MCTVKRTEHEVQTGALKTTQDDLRCGVRNLGRCGQDRSIPMNDVNEVKVMFNSWYLTHQVTSTVSPTFHLVELVGLVIGGATESRMMRGKDQTVDSKKASAKKTLNIVSIPEVD